MKMQNLKKKGFTLVELVIVIAVVAILAAVLIPTFASLVKRANLSADQQAERQINTLLATEFATDKPETLKEVVDMLDANGYNVDALVPLSKGYKFAWDKENNKIILLADSEVGTYETLDQGTQYINVKVSNAEAFKKALEAGSDVTLTADVTVSNVISIANDVTIELNGFNMDLSGNQSRPFELTENANLTIDAGSSTIKCGKYGLVNIPETIKEANVVLNGGNYIANTDNGAFIKVRPGSGNINITLNNVNYKDTSSDGFILNKNEFKGNLTVTVNGGSYEAFAGMQLDQATIKDATFKTNAAAFEVHGKATISNCKITVGNETVGTAPAAAVAASANGEVEVSNCTISGSCAYYVYSSGGTIKATNNTLTGVTDEFEITQDNITYPNAVSKVIINGVEKQ